MTGKSQFSNLSLIEFNDRESQSHGSWYRSDPYIYSSWVVNKCSQDYLGVDRASTTISSNRSSDDQSIVTQSNIDDFVDVDVVYVASELDFD